VYIGNDIWKLCTNVVLFKIIITIIKCFRITIIKQNKKGQLDSPHSIKRATRLWIRCKSHILVAKELYCHRWIRNIRCFFKLNNAKNPCFAYLNINKARSNHTTIRFAQFATNLG